MPGNKKNSYFLLGGGEILRLAKPKEAMKSNRIIMEEKAGRQNGDP